MKIKFILGNNQFTEVAEVNEWINKNEAYVKWSSGQKAYINLKDKNNKWEEVE